MMDVEKALLVYPLLIIVISVLILVQRGFNALIVLLAIATLAISLSLRKKIVKDKQLQP